MPQLDLTRKTSSDFLNLMTANNASRKVGYMMDEIDLSILQAQANANGELINPKFYDTAINKLLGMRQTISNPELVQRIDEQVARYQITRTSLAERIANADGPYSGVDIDEVIDQMEKSHEEDKRRIFEATYRDPEAFIKAMAQNELQWYEDVSRRVEDYHAATGNYPATVVNFGTKRFQDMQTYRKMELADEIGKDQYAVYIKTDAYGDMTDFTIKDRKGSFSSGSNFTESNFLRVGDWKKNGMQVFLQKYDTDENGNATVNWNGVTLEQVGERWSPPENTTVDDMFSQTNQAQIIHGDSGRFITTPDGKSYVFGGFDGQSGKWNPVQDETVIKRMGLWDAFTKSNTPITEDEFGTILTSDLVGEPVTMENVETIDKTRMEQLLQESRDTAWLRQGTTAETAGAAIGRFSEGFTTEKAREGAQPVVDVAQGTQALNEAIGGTLKGIGRSAPKAVADYPGAVYETGKGLVQSVGKLSNKTEEFFKGLFGFK